MKEKARSIRQSLKFYVIPKVIPVGLIDHVAMLLNAFPSIKNLDKPSPSALVHGNENIDYNVKRIRFGHTH